MLLALPVDRQRELNALVNRAATLIPVLQALELFEVGLLNVLHCGIEMGASELVVYGQ